MSSWHNIKEKLPLEGDTVAIYVDGWLCMAMYCNGDFYALKLDPVLGIPRKECIHNVELWRYFEFTSTMTRELPMYETATEKP